MPSRMHLVLYTTAAITLAALTTPVFAQPFGRGGDGPGWGPGMMMGPGFGGPGMMGRGGYGRMCGPGAAGFAEWRIDRMQRTLDLTADQRAKFDAFKDASTKAAQAMRDACPTNFPDSMTDRLGLMESRMETMLTGIKTVRPAFDAFYNSLTDAQKTRLNENRGRFGRWRDRW